jgi:hypothetical protein
MRARPAQLDPEPEAPRSSRPCTCVKNIAGTDPRLSGNVLIGDTKRSRPLADCRLSCCLGFSHARRRSENSPSEGSEDQRRINDRLKPTLEEETGA